MKASKLEAVLILHDLRSAYNVGSIFRTADAVGVSRIYLTGYTPAPVDKFGRANKEIAKTALGSEKSAEWEYQQSISDLIHHLKTNHYHLIVLEQSHNSVDYKMIKLTRSTAIILGNEVKGVAKEILDQCDLVAEIPMRGKKESLNVAVAAGVFLFRLLDN